MIAIFTASSAAPRRRASRCARPTRRRSTDMPTRHEEQAHQQAAKRLDVGFELVAEIGFGQQDARQEGAERHGHADRLHQNGGAEHDEQGARR